MLLENLTLIYKLILSHNYDSYPCIFQISFLNQTKEEVHVIITLYWTAKWTLCFLVKYWFLPLISINILTIKYIPILNHLHKIFVHESTCHSEPICFTTFQKTELIIITFTFLFISIYYFSWFLQRPSSTKNKLILCLELPWKPCNQIGSLPEMIPQSLQCQHCSEIHFLATKEEKLITSTD